MSKQGLLTIAIPHGAPFHSVTAFSDDDGRYRLAETDAPRRRPAATSLH